MRGTRSGKLSGDGEVDGCPVGGWPVDGVPVARLTAPSANEQAMSASGSRRCKAVTGPGSSSFVGWRAATMMAPGRVRCARLVRRRTAAYTRAMQRGTILPHRRALAIVLGVVWLVWRMGPSTILAAAPDVRGDHPC